MLDGKQFDFRKVESRLLEKWQKEKIFVVNDNEINQKKFSTIMPPPNANESLHCGHSLYMTLQDISTRLHRKLGYTSLMIPGLDHAGIETQVVYEDKLSKNGQSRFDFSREELYSLIYEYVEGNARLAKEQMLKLGLSADFDKIKFTLDEDVRKRLLLTLKDFDNRKLLYRDYKIVNYSPKYQTTFSGLEIKYKQEQSKLYHIAYKIGEEQIIVATTRPETIFGDTAIAINPSNELFKHLVNKLAKIPLTDREIPIIIDQLVDSDFGTGAVKVTPAHDALDWQIAQKHNLPRLNLLDKDGLLSENVPERYIGLTTTEARKKIVNELKESGALVKEENYTHQVAYTSKGDDKIEPILMKQWFIRMKDFARKLIEDLENNLVDFKPIGFKNSLINWLENIEDWNISRQIVWGIRLPIYYSKNNMEKYFVGEAEEAKEYFKNEEFYQDSDVLDTWFSSGHWPLVTLGYPSKLWDEFAPTDLMVTGKEIIFLWVSRMIMLSRDIAGKIPFKTVYINGYITDEKGVKMSKSKFNGINPMPIIEEYGADALRLSLISNSAAAMNQSLSIQKIAGYRSFITKLFNLAKFYSNQVSDNKKIEKSNLVIESIFDYWILDGLSKAKNRSIDNFKALRYGEGLKVLYNFVWHYFADWYIEISKVEKNYNLVGYVLQTILELLNPVTPFITEYLAEELFSINNLPNQEFTDINLDLEPSKIKSAETFFSVVVFLRNLTKELDSEIFIDSRSNRVILNKLTGISFYDNQKNYPKKILINSEFDIYIYLKNEHLETLSSKLNKKEIELNQKIEQIKKRLGNKNFLENADKLVIERDQNNLKMYTSQLNESKEILKLIK